MPIDSLILSPSINTTTTIDASRNSVWPRVRAVNEWSDFTSAFDIVLNGGNGLVEVDQDLLITTDFIFFSQQTINRIYEITEGERICWRLESIVFGGLEIAVPSVFLRNEGRCIEVFDREGGGTVVHNWEIFGGLFWPAVALSTGSRVRQLFEQFNNDLTAVNFNSL